MQIRNTSDQIISDLSTEDPQYALHDLNACQHAAMIDSLIKTRRTHGLKAFLLKLQNIKESNELLYRRLTTPQENPTVPTTPAMDTAKLVFPESAVPPLPASAKLEAGLLPSVSPWLTEYIDYSKRVSPEGYRDFHLACGLWALSTVAARRLQVPLGVPVLTPLTLVMVARTSLFAKSTTARAGTMLLKSAGLKCFLGADETTPQRLLYDMAGHVPTNWSLLSQQDQEDKLNRLSFAAQRGWYYDEMGQLLNAMSRPSGPMADFTGLLRKLDNCEDEYTYATKSGGEECIKKPYLSLLGSTTPANMCHHMGSGSEMWNDGFWARVLFVCPEPHSFLTCTADSQTVYPSRKLIERLQTWHTRLGIPSVSITEQEDPKTNKPTGVLFAEVEPLATTDIGLDPSAYQAFVNYRVALRQIIAGRVHGQDLDGSYARLPTQALRIAALIASIEQYPCITMDVWIVAQEIAEVFRANLHSLYEQVSERPEDNPVEDLLIEFLKTQQSKPVTVREILQFAPSQIRKLKADGIRLMLKELERDGIVALVRDGRKECYTLSA